MESTSANRATATVVVHESGMADVTIGDYAQSLAANSATAARENAISVIAAHATLLDRPITVQYAGPEGSSKLIVTKDGEVRESTRSFNGSITITAPNPITGGSARVQGDAPTGQVPTVLDDEPVRATGRWVPTGARPAEPVAPVIPPAAAPAQQASPPATPQPETTLAPEPVAAENAAAPRAELRAANRPAEALTRAEAAEANRVPERTAAPRRSFIEEAAKAPRAEKGVRGVFAKMGFNVAPSAAEAAERDDIVRVSQHWPGPRTIAIVNGKGGASKTPTTAMLSAVFARHGGSGVLAWDNNETRGTLGWRTEQGHHDATVQNLLPNADHLMSSAAQASDLTSYLHHQVADKYDVLRSNPNILAADQRLTTNEFDAIHAVATKYFRLIFIDSGNDESADRWRRMIDRADQIVIATTARGEHAEAGALLLEALRERGDHGARLAENAIVVVSQADHKGGVAQAEHVAEGFRQMARGANVIPFDPAMRAGKLTFDSLKPETQRAWLAAAAAVARGL